MPRRPASLLLAAVAALAFAACGNKEAERHVGETEAAYVTVGDLKYQVQISRLLNPADREDAGYLVALPPEAAQLKPDDEWFGVFMRVENETGEQKPAASKVEIRDTQGTVFEPVAFGPDNVFAYRAVVIPGGTVVPLADSPAAENTIQGSLLLFKIPYQNLENRPLELEITSPTDPGQVGRITLDV